MKHFNLGFALTLALILLIFLLAGCATAPQGPEPVAISTHTVEVVKPIPVACIKAEDVHPKPARPDVDIAKCTPRQCAAAMDMDYRALIDYSDWADSVIQQCTKGATP